MTQVTERSPMLPADWSRSAALASAFARGVIAAGLGLGSLAVLVMALWISSPYPDSGPDGAFHVATGLWLLAHGAELSRTGTLGGHPAPVATVPLLLGVLPVWLVHRAARDAAETDAKTADRHSAAGAFCAVSGGYLLVVLAAAAYGRGGGLPVDRPALAFPVAFVVTGSAAAGVWAARGRSLTSLLVRAPLGLQEAAARTGFRAAVTAVLRSAAAGTLALLVGGAVLVTTALVWHAGDATDSLLGLSGDWAGRSSVLLLAVALLPNAAMWGAAYGLGPGFALGTASTVTPFAFTGPPALPDFPLLAAVPSQGPGTAVNWAAAVVPVVAALAVARRVARVAAPLPGERPGGRCGDLQDTWGQGRTALVTGLGAVGCGIGAAALAGASGGPLGTGALAEFGPVWWLVGSAALAWTAVIGVPAALLLRAWRLRENRWGWRRDATAERAGPEAVAPDIGLPERAGRGSGGPAGEGGAETEGAKADEEPYGFQPAGSWHSAGSWHEEGARKARWAALRRKSGGLMAGFSALPEPGAGAGSEPAAVEAPTAGPGAGRPFAAVTGPEAGPADARLAADPGAVSASGAAPLPAPARAGGPPAPPDGPPVPDPGPGVPPTPGKPGAPSAPAPESGPEEPAGPGPDADGRPDPGRPGAP